jgi:3-hydroxymyristoyl/3-hydroxydecanoyl-(acyl carrier protein) dehydratase
MDDGVLQQIFRQKKPNEWPEYVIIDSRECFLKLQLSIKSNLVWFDGHFPDQPVLPGVVQIHWAGLLSRYFFSRSCASFTLENVKFKNMIVPGDVVFLTLDFIQEKNRIEFTYEWDGVVFSSGIMRLSLL